MKENSDENDAGGASLGHLVRYIVDQLARQLTLNKRAGIMAERFV